MIQISLKACRSLFFIDTSVQDSQTDRRPSAGRPHSAALRRPSASSQLYLQVHDTYIYLISMQNGAVVHIYSVCFSVQNLGSCCRIATSSDFCKYQSGLHRQFKATLFWTQHYLNPFPIIISTQMVENSFHSVGLVCFCSSKRRGNVSL